MLLFVYGTLMKDCSNHELIRGSKFIAKAVAKGKLYDLNVGFPAMTDEEGEVLGEVYDVDDSRFDDVDELEGYYPDNEGDSLYLRREIEVTTLKKEKFAVQTYVMPQRSLRRFSAEWLDGGMWRE